MTIPAAFIDTQLDVEYQYLAPVAAAILLPRIHPSGSFTALARRAHDSAGDTNTNSEKLTSIQVGSMMGGTGKFATIQGTVRILASFDYKTGFNESQSNNESHADIEHSVAK